MGPTLGSKVSGSFGRALHLRKVEKGFAEAGHTMHNCLTGESSACMGGGTFMRLNVSMASDRWFWSHRAVIMASYTCALAAQPCCCPRASSSAAC